MNKIKFVFIAIIVVWVLSYTLHRIMLRPKLDINNIPLENIVSIKVYDRGIFGNDSLFINNIKKVRMLSNLVISSVKVDFDRINTKANQGLCEIELTMRNKDDLTIELINTSFSGGIIGSGHFYYRNDSLLNLIKKSLNQGRL